MNRDLDLALATTLAALAHSAIVHHLAVGPRARLIVVLGSNLAATHAHKFCVSVKDV